MMANSKSPKYPNFSLRQAVAQAEKVFKADRRSPITREDAVKHMGYTGLSGASDKALGTIVQYGLLGNEGKGEVRVTQLTVDILHADNESQRREALRKAAWSPPLFKMLKERYPEGASPQALRSYLVRENFLDRAINPVISAFAETQAFLAQQGATESGGSADLSGAESPPPSDPDDGVEYGGARVGDLVQWESDGALQFGSPLRVRLVSDDSQWIAVEGSETGIPMNQVIVEERPAPPAAPPPRFSLDREFGLKAAEGEAEWMRNSLGTSTKVRLLVTGDMGPREIGKLIKLLEAQRAVLDDEDDLVG